MSEQTNVIEEAVRKGVRFTSDRGNITTEDLYQLPLQSQRGVSLDSVAVQCNRELKALTEESFVAERSAQNTEAQLKMDVVKHIIDIRKAEREAAKNLAEKKERKEKILRALESKQNAELDNASKEDLQKMLDEL